MELFDLQRNVNEDILKLRSLYRLITDPRFEQAWDNSSDKPYNFIQNNDIEGLRLWMLENTDLESKSLKQLKELAYRRRILNWSRMDKETLILELQNEQRRNVVGDRIAV